MTEPLCLVILASGRGSNFVALADACAAGNVPARIALLVTDNPSAPALERAAERGIATRVVERDSFPDRAAFDDGLAAAVREGAPGLVCLAGFMRILSPRFLAGAGAPVINIHPSLLPAFPGLHAQRQALEYGVKVAGCTVHFVDEGVDTGPVILQKTVPVEPDDTEESLAARILVQEHLAYPEAVRLIAGGKVIPGGGRR